MIVDKTVCDLLLAKVFDGVGPEDITHKTVGRRLSEAVDLGTSIRQSF